ncbi:MAG: hypothetical protein K2Q01_08485, partial [Rickettsiales bacterium]|nr:hypothetical protein [Rickettsiales bacterium]
AVSLAGAIQIVLGLCRAGIIGDFIPSAVIKGMLAAIGLILILKQFPHAVGYDADYEGDEAFEQHDGGNTFSSLWDMLQNHIEPGALVVAVISLLFLFWWDSFQPRQKNFIRYVPGPLVVVLFGVLANEMFKAFLPDLAIASTHLVNVPIASSLNEFVGQFTAPDFSLIADKKIWIVAVTIAVVASVETLLSIEAIDRLDPFKRITPTSHELLAQGVGNITSGLLGGLPVTSVIVRSSANSIAGGRTKMSAISHGMLLLLCVVFIPALLNLIPLSALAAILIAVGYKLTKPSIFMKKYEKGWSQFIPFVVTIIAILLTDLLVGIGIGVAVGVAFMLVQNFQSAIMFVQDNNNYLVRSKKDLFFLHKYELKRTLSRIPRGAAVLLDLSRITFMDLDNVEIINDFIAGAKHRGISVVVKRNNDCKATSLIEEAA